MSGAEKRRRKKQLSAMDEESRAMVQASTRATRTANLKAGRHIKWSDSATPGATKPAASSASPAAGSRRLDTPAAPAADAAAAAGGAGCALG